MQQVEPDRNSLKKIDFRIIQTTSKASYTTQSLLKNNSYAKFKHLDLIIDFVKITAQSTALKICKFAAWGIQLT
jgi:hypothetical protein